MNVPYVYLIKNKITEQFYIGSRNKNVATNLKPEEDLWFQYFTSSKKVQKLIQEFGKDSFEVDILFRHEDYEVCYWYEQLCIKETIKNIRSLNAHYIDPIDDSKHFNTVGRKHTEETRKKISERLLGGGTSGIPLSEDHKYKISAARLGMKFSEETRNKMSLARKGKKKPPMSEEQKQKISEFNKGRHVGALNSQFGTCWICKEGIAKKIYKETLEQYLQDGWSRGRN